MIRSSTITALLVLTSVAVGNCNEVVFTAHGAAPGTYYYAMEVQADGSLNIRQLETVPIGGDPIPDPDPDPDPKTTQEKVARWTNEVNDPSRAITKRAIASVYELIAKNVEDGDVRVDQMKVLTDELYSRALNLVGKKQNWATWKSKVDTLPVSVQTWKDIAAGLRASGASVDDVLDRIRNLRQDMIREVSCEISNQHGVF